MDGEGAVKIQGLDKRYRIMLLCIFLAVAFGCSHSNANAPPPPPGAVNQPQQAPAPPAGPAVTYGPPAEPHAVPAPPSPPAPKAKFFEFNDIPVPPELNVRPNSSNVFQAGQIKMGFLTLRGRVDSNSLVNYFVAALPHEGWRLKGQFRYSRSLLIFDKPDKVCVILMKEETYYTYVEIYVSPVAGS